jgi:hypothetical protein
MRTLSLITLVAIAFAAGAYDSFTLAQAVKTPDGTVDVFPLLIGGRWAYSYAHEDGTSGGECAVSRKFLESGWIGYTVLDSTRADDSTIAWAILQERHLFRRHFEYGWGVFIDTAYTIDDSTELVLTEYTTGFHELECQSAVWRFPLPAGIFDSSRIPIYRFADTTSVTIGRGCAAWVTLTEDSGWTSGVCYPYCKVYDWAGCALYDFTVSAMIEIPVTSVEERTGTPGEIGLHQNYPNPFNPTTTITVSVPFPSTISLTIFDLLGREVETLFEGVMPLGSQTLRWDAAGLPGGVYFCVMRSGGITQTRKLALVR